MRKLLAGIMLLAACNFASADDLAEADKAFAIKSYDIAMRMYQRLADGGNAAAQFKLGEMYWYGEGTTADLSKASALFQQSAAAGNANAAAALNVIKQRQLRGADINYWVAVYNGDDLKAAASCPVPAIPEVSKSNAEIATVSQSVTRWRECYNAYIDKMSAVLPAGKAIPNDIQVLMNEQEYNTAIARLDSMYASVGGAQKAGAERIMTDYQRWAAATEQYADDHNRVVNARNIAMKDEMEAMKRQLERGNMGDTSRYSRPSR